MSARSGRAETSRFADKALEGRLEALSLFDVCQFLMLNRKTGTLTVRAEARAAYLTFHEGQLLNAVDDAFREGEDVVLSAVQWTTGSFVFDLGPVPTERRIDASTENILLEAARRLDEMSLGEGGGEGGREEAFLETQAKARALSDAFRAAVNRNGERSLGEGWKETLVDALAQGRADRVLLGPRGWVRIVINGFVQAVDPPSTREVDVWIDDLLPTEGDWDEYNGLPVVQAVPTREFGLLWVGRYASPSGPWLAVGKPTRVLPEWSAWGLPEELSAQLEALRARVSLLLYSRVEEGQFALAAWLGQRTESECGWIVEDWPRYDWSEVIGRYATLRPGDLQAQGSLTTLVRASGASLLVILDPRSPALIQEALGLVRGGMRVVVGLACSSLPEALSLLKGMGCPVPADHLGGAWQIEAIEPEVPRLKSRLHLPRPSTSEAA